MKSRVSEDRFLIPGLWALSSFSFALLGEKKKSLKLSPVVVGRRQCLLSVYLRRPLPSATTSGSTQLSVSWEVPQKCHTAVSTTHNPATLWTAVDSWWTSHCTADFVLEETASCSFLLTSNFSVTVRSPKNILPLSIKWHLFFPTAMVCKSA